ncbi:MAG: hypothetical protein J4F41_04530 [Alphaproteobacteria bacterium]|nr:hypothetical protein [Alphaproteobacteria bacterium]
MSDTSSSSPTMSHNGLTYALYDDKSCGGCGADNWRGEKLALAHIPEAETYLCPPCVNTYLAKITKS